MAWKPHFVLPETNLSSLSSHRTQLIVSVTLGLLRVASLTFVVSVVTMSGTTHTNAGFATWRVYVHGKVPLHKPGLYLDLSTH